MAYGLATYSLEGIRNLVYGLGQGRNYRPSLYPYIIQNPNRWATTSDFPFLKNNSRFAQSQGLRSWEIIA